MISALKKNMDDWQVYLLRCCDGNLYCGITNNIYARTKIHNVGKGAKYTKGRLPVEVSEPAESNPTEKLEYLLYSKSFEDKVLEKRYYVLSLILQKTRGSKLMKYLQMQKK